MANNNKNKQTKQGVRDLGFSPRKKTIQLPVSIFGCEHNFIVHERLDGMVRVCNLCDTEVKVRE